jgi:hypothetical protein
MHGQGETRAMIRLIPLDLMQHGYGSIFDESPTHFERSESQESICGQVNFIIPM